MNFFAHLFYNIIILFFVVLYTPFHCLRILFFEKHRRSTLPRLGFQKIPHFSKDDLVYWIHAVSVGEVKAIREVINQIKNNQPQAKIIISTITETGQNTAKELGKIDASFYFPIDFYFLIKKMVQKINPNFLIIVETDLWLNLLQLSKKNGAKIFLVNGKLSQTSQNRYAKFPLFKNLLLNPFSHIFSQTDTYTKRFLDSGIPMPKISTLGNLKLDFMPTITKEKEQEKRLLNFGLDNSKPIIVFASTHKGEDEIALRLLKRMDIFLILAPRHPERFKSVENLISKEIAEYNKFTDFHDTPLDKKNVLLLDTLGELMVFYEICDLAIIGGSFIPDVGGHNIFEPAFYKKPFIFGNYLYKQPGFEQLARDFQAGIQCNTATLPQIVDDLLQDKEKMIELGERGYQAVQNSKDLSKTIYDKIISM